MVKQEEVITEELAPDEMGAVEQETPVEQPPGNPFADRLKKRYPDKEFQGDDEINASLIEYLDELEGFQSSTQEADEKLREVLENAPELTAIIRDISKGASFTEALSRHIDVDELTPMEGDPDFDAWNNNLAERKKSRAEKEQRQKMYQENLDMTVGEIKQFAQDNDMSEEQTQSFLSAIGELVNDIVDGRLNKPNLMRLKKAIDYDTDVQSAAKTAEISAKNEKIEAKKADDKKKVAGDGLPNIVGQGGKDVTPKPKDDWEDAIDMEKNRRNKLI